MPLTGNLDPGQTSGLHWACSRGARQEGPGRCRGSYRNCWARTRRRGAGGGGPSLVCVRESPAARTHARSHTGPGVCAYAADTHTYRAGLQLGVPVCVCAPRDYTGTSAHKHKYALTHRRAWRRVHALASGHTDAHGRSAAGSPGICAPQVYTRVRANTPALTHKRACRRVHALHTHTHTHTHICHRVNVPHTDTHMHARQRALW